MNLKTLSEERGLPSNGRRIPVEPLFALLNAIEGHADRDRVMRACTQYQIALQHWTTGREMFALAHIFMGMEALAKARVRKECERRRMDEAQLWAAVRVERKDLESWARRILLFQCDVECHRQAKLASDGLEHGFLGLDDVHFLASATRDQAAKYLRSGILDVLDSNDGPMAELHDEKYASVLGASPILKIIRGKLIGDGPSLAAVGQCYPRVDWKSTIKKFRDLGGGKFEVTPEETWTAWLGEEIAIQMQKYEVYGPTAKTRADTSGAPNVH